jgi:monoamine oxidase
MPQPDVIVIGAGMAGVTAARALRREGLHVIVLEARPRIGGRVHTLRDFCDAPVEAGAELIHGKRAPTWAEVREAGLSTRGNSHAAILMDLGHGTHWLPVSLLHPDTWAAFWILRRIARHASPDVSAGAFIDSHRYRGRARALAEMVFTAHLPGSIDDIGVHGLIGDGVLELETSADYRVNEGYGRIVEHIAQGLDIELGFIAQTIQWSPDAVAVRTPDGRERRARAAIATVPAGVLQSGAIRFEPELPENKRSALQSMVMGPVSKLIMRFEAAFWPKQMAAVCSASGPVTLYWNVFYRSPVTTPVLTAYCTGPRAAGLARMSDDEAIDCVIRDLRRHFPRSHPRLADWRRVDWSADPFACGGYTYLRPGGAKARVKLAAADTGALFWAGSETATEPIAATVGGAYASGLRAARATMTHLTARPHGDSSTAAP